jgi:hypothetical protein
VSFCRGQRRQHTTLAFPVSKRVRFASFAGDPYIKGSTILQISGSQNGLKARPRNKITAAWRGAPALSCTQPAQHRATSALQAILARGIRVRIRGAVKECRDPGDDMLLACAALAKADLLVADDKD